MSYVYIESERALWTVGFYDPSGEWHPDTDHNDRESAASRVAYLNGSGAQRPADPNPPPRSANGLDPQF